jgi:hypothetical protein
METRGAPERQRTQHRAWVAGRWSAGIDWLNSRTGATRFCACAPSRNALALFRATSTELLAQALALLRRQAASNANAARSAAVAPAATRQKTLRSRCARCSGDIASID